MSIARYDDTTVDDPNRKDEAEPDADDEGEVWDFGQLDEHGLMQVRDLINKILKEQYGHTA